MKKILAMLCFMSSLYSGRNSALFDLDLGDTFGGAEAKVNTIGNEGLLFMGFTLGNRQCFYIYKL